MMKTHNKTILAVASTVVLLSGCGGGGGDSGSSAPATKTTLTPEIRRSAPMTLPAPGLYTANLLQRDGNHLAPIMMTNPSGLAFIYPKDAVDQRWVVSIKGQPNTQWVGKAGQKANRVVGIYPVSVTRTTNLDGDTPLTVDNLGDIAFAGFLTASGRKLTGFDFTQTSSFADGTPLYPNWMGRIALSPIPSATGELVDGSTWQQQDAAGNNFAFVKTANNSGDLTVEIALSAANCTLEGKGVASKGLSKLDVTGFDSAKCDFKASSNPLENQWMTALGKAAKGQSVTTAYVATYASAANKEQLVIGFPELDGLLITADKQ